MAPLGSLRPSWHCANFLVMPAEPDSTLASRPLTVGQVAERFAVDPDTVTRWANEGLIPFFTTPKGHRRFYVEDVERFTTARLSA